MVYNCKGSSLKVTACDLKNSEEEFVSVLAFPSKKQYSLRVSNVSDDVHSMLSHLSHPSDAFSGKVVEVPFKHYIFVCSDANTDKRCGYCGPRLATAFKEKLAELSLSDSVKVVKTSHVGGHKYAGNVIVFPAGEYL